MLNNLLMLNANAGGVGAGSNYQPFPVGHQMGSAAATRHQGQYVAQSFDSLNNNSVNSTSASFLTAANTIVFDDSSGCGTHHNNNSLSSNSSSFIQLAAQPGLGSASSSYASQRPPNSFLNQSSLLPSPSLSKLLEQQQQRSSFSSALIDARHPSHLDDLDFELNYEAEKSAAKVTTTTTGRALFNGDDNLFEEEDDISIESAEFAYDEMHGAGEQFVAEMSMNEDDRSNQPVHQPSQSVRFLLENPLRLASLSKNVPIEQTATGTVKATDVNNNHHAGGGEGGGGMAEKSGVNGGGAGGVKYANQNSINSAHSPLAGVSFSSNATDTMTPQNNSLLGSSVTNKYNTSRSLMKLQLMKQQVEDMERKLPTNAPSLATAAASSNLPPPLTASSTNNQSMYASAASTLTLTASESKSTHPTLHFAEPSSIPVSPTSFGGVESSTSVSSSIEEQHPKQAMMPAEIIPRSVLNQTYKMDTKLEFPTKYHVMQRLAKTNMLKQPPSPSSDSPASKSSTSRLGARMAKGVSGGGGGKPTSSSGKPMLLQQQQSHVSSENSNGGQVDFDQMSSCRSVDSQNSNFDPSLISSPASSTFSQSDDLVPEELKTFLNNNHRRSGSSSYLSSSEIEHQLLENFGINSPKTVPNEAFYFNVSTPPSMNGSGHSQTHQASTSCPSDLARIKKLQSMNLTEEEIRHILKDIKDKQKKENHNMIERRRRFNINDRIKELGGILSRENQLSDKQNKGLILKASIDYIRNLEGKLNRTRELEDKLSQMTMLNKQLMTRINELELASPPPTQSSQSQMISEYAQKAEPNENIKLASLLQDATNSCENRSSQHVNAFTSNSNTAGQQQQHHHHHLQNQPPTLIQAGNDFELMPAEVLEDMLNFYQDNSLITCEEQANVVLGNAGLLLNGGAKSNQIDSFN